MRAKTTTPNRSGQYLLTEQMGLEVWYEEDLGRSMDLSLVCKDWYLESKE